MSPRSKATPANRPFFVYGTLLPGQPNAYLWGDTIVSSQLATLTGGRLYDMGNYPMLIEKRDGIVHGRLLYLDEARYQDIVSAIDVLEGFDENHPDKSVYQRVVREVSISDGSSKQAWVYVGKAQYVANAVPIESGNWPRYIGTKLSQINAWWREMDSVSGLHGPGS